MTANTLPDVIEDVWWTDAGPITFRRPRVLSPESVEELVEWLEMILRHRLKRLERAEKLAAAKPLTDGLP